MLKIPVARACLSAGLAVALAACSGLPGSESAREPAGRTPSFEQPAAPADPMPLSNTTPREAAPRGPEARIVLGSDRFTAAPAAVRPAGGGPITETADGEVILNFADADVREVVRSVLGDILQLTYSVDPEVAGTVTLQSAQPIPRDAILPALESVLRANGAGLVREGALHRIVALAETRSFAPPVNGAGGYGVQVVPLRHIAASEMVGILELLVPDGGLLNADSARNLVIFSGSREDRQTLLDTVALFDVDQFAGMSFGLFPLRNANAETLVGELQAIFSEAGFSPSHELLRFIPVARLNAVIAISPRANYLEQAQSWIAQLDQGIDSASPRVHVYSVQNVRAANLAAVLNEVFEQSDPPSSAEPAPFVPAAYSPAEPAPQTGDPGPSAAPPEAGIPFAGNSRIRVIADEATNALLVLATPQAYRMVEQAIRKLDVVPLQVLIEATIAEVTLNDALRYGVQWFLDSGDGEATLSDFIDGAVGQAFPGFSALYRLNGDVRVVLNALSDVTDVKVISSPQLMVLDNQTAELQVGDQVPIATQSAVSVSDSQAPIVNSIEFRDTGVILRVTPRVNAGGLVVMDIAQEVSSVVNTTTSGIDSPTIQQRKINSSVAIQSGETVTLGGLMSEARESGTSGLPVLSEIPVVGSLFGRKSNSSVRTELLVLITPRVVANRLDARKVTEELRSRLRSLLTLNDESR